MWTFLRREPGGSDQLVDIDGARAERTNDQLAFALADIGQGLGRPVFVGGGKPRSGRSRAAEDRRQCLDDVARRR